ncbi:hypothetical protein LUZ61_013679 [Rhynchospora tenuis]|uniref:NB-ARC domain-containing protein n=1 Tax=Rhynchospora tenuis TaxID=198213 RepID=A0AAD5Z0D0_9POAL|nr:hypothetical protein LUZ61_013679 [Rhynchospora tenuis]
MGFITAAIGVGWVVSPVITLVINKIESHIEKKYFKNSETGKYLKEMQTSLQEIHVIMVRVEKQRIENRELVQGIKDAIYEAEDVVNEFEYDLLDKEKSVEQSGSSIKSVEQSGSSFIIDKFKLAVMEKGKELSENLDKLDWPILGDKEFKKKVKEVSERLVRAKESAMILLDSIKNNNSTNIQSPEQENELDTSSQIDEEIIGRIEERKELIELLFKEENNATPTIIQIVGHGGIGKTTLARLVYNDPRKLTEPRGQDFFELNIWLSVSENFDGIKLTKEMLKYVSPNFTLSDTSFDLLQKELKEKLASKRILLVLDNVWYVKDVNRKSSFEQNWLKFLAPLKKTKPGSKIIVTTREGVVDNTLESFGSLEVMKLGGLNDADSWSLLKIKAFGRKNHHNRHDLEPIGEDLVKNLKGFPLAIRVVGTELRGESKKEEWERILNENALDKSDIMDILLRSYKHLPDYLQPCFAYCSLFPKVELYIEDMEGLEEWSSPCGFQSFPKLRRLKLSYCPELFSLPEMESFCSLESVRIEICPKVKSLPKLPVSLRNLQVKGLHDLKQFYGSNIFSSLEELYIDDMEGLEEWSSPCGVQSFSKLRRLELYDCPKLFSLPKLESFCSLESVRIEICPKVRSLPKLPVSLRNLQVKGFHDLKQFYGSNIFPSLEELYIDDMEGLEEWSSPCGVQSFLKLRRLELYDCPKLFSLPKLESFRSLEYVRIEICPKVRLLPKLPVSLRYLDIVKVHPNLEEQLGNKNGPEWDKVATVSGCHCEIFRDGTWEVVQDGSEESEEDFSSSSEW